MIPKPLRKAVIKSYHNGLSRLEIAIKYGISTGSVSNIIKEYEDALAIFDLVTIRKISKAIKKSGISIKELARAAEFVLFMEEQYKTEEAKDSLDFKGFLENSIVSVTNFYDMCYQYDTPPSIISVWIKDLQDFALKIQTSSIKLAKLNSETGKDTSPALTRLVADLRVNTKIPFVSAISSYMKNLKKEYEKFHHLENTLVESVRKLKLEKTTLQTNIDQLIQKEEEAMRYLSWFRKLEEELDNNPSGVQIDDIELFAKAMNEFALRGYNANNILAELDHLESAPIKIMIMEREFAKLLDKKNVIERNTKFYEIRISEYLETILRVNYLEIMGFGYDHLVWITRIIERISKIENISLKRAANKLLKDIDLQY